MLSYYMDLETQVKWLFQALEKARAQVSREVYRVVAKLFEGTTSEREEAQGIDTQPFY